MLLLLSLVFFASLENGHGQNRTGSTAHGGLTLRMSVSHVYDAHSPLRPKECGAGDDRGAAACLSAHHLQRLFNGSTSVIKSKEEEKKRKGRKLVTPWAYVAAESHGGRTFDYYASLSIGTPPQPQILLLDTGSDLSWIQCKPCAPCYPQSLPVFNGRRSSTNRLQTINDAFCQAVQRTPLGIGADRTACFYRLQYDDGTSSNGGLIFDDITFWDHDGNPGDIVTLQGIAFGCGTSNFLSVPSLTSGTLGLAKSRGFSIPEQLSLTLGDSFSYCLAPTQASPNSGFIYLGVGSIPASTNDSASFIANTNYWYFNIIDIYVGTSFLHLPFGTLDFDPTTRTGGTLVDSGYVLPQITGAAYFPFRDAWRAALQSLLGNPGPGYGQLDTCYDYPNDMNLPLIAFLFSDGSMFTPRNSANMYIYTSNSGRRRMCWPYLPLPSGIEASFILGANAQISTRMVFDTQNQRLGWIYDSC